MPTVSTSGTFALFGFVSAIIFAIVVLFAAVAVLRAAVVVVRTVVVVVDVVVAVVVGGVFLRHRSVDDGVQFGAPPGDWQMKQLLDLRVERAVLHLGGAYRSGRRQVEAVLPVALRDGAATRREADGAAVEVDARLVLQVARVMLDDHLVVEHRREAAVDELRRQRHVAEHEAAAEVDALQAALPPPLARCRHRLPLRTPVQHLHRRPTYYRPVALDVVDARARWRHGEADDVAALQARRHHVHFPGAVQFG